MALDEFFMLILLYYTTVNTFIVFVLKKSTSFIRLLHHMVLGINSFNIWGLGNNEGGRMMLNQTFTIGKYRNNLLYVRIDLFLITYMMCIQLVMMNNRADAYHGKHQPSHMG